MMLFGKPADRKRPFGLQDDGPKNYRSIEHRAISYGKEVGNEATSKEQNQKNYPYFRFVSAFFLIAGSAFALRNGTAPTGLSSAELVKASATSVLQSCPPVQLDPKICLDSRPVLPNQVGRDFTSQYTRTDLMRGYKATERKENLPLKGMVFKDPDQNAGLVLERIAQQYYTKEIIQKKEEVSKVLGIDGQLTVSYGPVSGSGSGKFLDKHVSTKTKVVVTVVNRNTYFQIKVRDNGSLEYSDRIQDLVDANDMNAIYDQFGTYMTSAVQYGCSLYARYEITSETEIDRTEIKAQLQGKIGRGPLSGAIKAKFESENGSGRSLYQMKIVGKVQGLNIDFPDLSGLDGFNAANGIMEEFTKKKNETLEEANGKTDIDELTKIYSPSAIVLDRIDSFVYIPDMDPNAAAYINDQARRTGAVLQDSYFSKDRLEEERAVLANLFPGGRDYWKIYVPYRDAAEILTGNVDAKIGECMRFLQKKAKDIVCQVLKAPAPLDKKYKGEIVGLLGGGFVEEPWESDNMYYEGYTIGRGAEREPFYKGRLLCNRNNFNVLGEKRIETLKDFVRDNPDPPICYETSSPTSAPTRALTSSPTSSELTLFYSAGFSDNCLYFMTTYWDKRGNVLQGEGSESECAKYCYDNQMNIPLLGFAFHYFECACFYIGQGAYPFPLRDNLHGRAECYKSRAWPAKIQ